MAPGAPPRDQRARQRLGVYGIGRDVEGRILLVRAATHLSVAGRWFLPGGGVHHGETPADALRREVREETGLAVGAVALLGVLSDTWPLDDGTLLHTVRLVYRLDDWTGTLRDEASGSSDRAAWFFPRELESVKLVRYVRDALARFSDVAPRPAPS